MVNTEKIRKRYDRASRFYDLLESPMEAMSLKEWRIKVMEQLYGKVLEVGVGTGKNIAYYPNNLDITAIDFSNKMLDKAKEKAKKYAKEVTLIEMDAQNMNLPDNYFDCVFTTCVFCSVPDPVMGLSEIRRVCKSGGKIIMIEHVRSEKAVLGVLMDLFNPIVVSCYGANINRRTVENIKLAGFTAVEVKNLFSDIVMEIIIYNEK